MNAVKAPSIMKILGRGTQRLAKLVADWFPGPMNVPPPSGIILLAAKMGNSVCEQLWRCVSKISSTPSHFNLDEKGQWTYPAKCTPKGCGNKH